MIVRATAKLRNALKVSTEDRVAPTAPTETWNANLVRISRWQWLLLMHEATLFPVAVPGVRAADLRRFPALVCDSIEGALADLDLPAATFGPLDRADVRVTPTADRSMLGHLNQMKFEVEYSVWGSRPDPESVDVGALHRELAQTPRARDRSYIFAIDLVRELVP